MARRTLMHVVVGSRDWEATPEELERYAALFAAADNNSPAVVVTRPEVQVVGTFELPVDDFAAATCEDTALQEKFVNGQMRRTAPVEMNQFTGAICKPAWSWRAFAGGCVVGVVGLAAAAVVAATLGFDFALDE